METPQRVRARGRARLRTLTALTAGLSIAGVVGIAVATHGGNASTNSSNSTKGNTNDDNNLQAPTTSPQNSDQQPQANSQGS